MPLRGLLFDFDGLLIDTLGANAPEDERTNRALAANFDAMKTRLRQLGFFTDLSDASNSQTIIPRFLIVADQVPEPASAG